MTVNLSLSFSNVFSRNPLQEQKDAPLIDVSQRVSFRHSNALNLSEYSTLQQSVRESEA
jgi:hypothetical protein